MYHNQPFTKLILILAAASLLCANSNTEKLARKVERDNKQVVKWNDKAQKDGQVLERSMSGDRQAGRAARAGRTGMRRLGRPTVAASDHNEAVIF